MARARHRAASRSPGLFGGLVALLIALIVGILIVRPFGSPAGLDERGPRSGSTAAPASRVNRPWRPSSNDPYPDGDTPM